MKIFIITIFLLFNTLNFVSAQNNDIEKELIKNVIQTAYIDGLHNKGELALIEEGFHPGFNLLGVRDNSLSVYPIYTWIESYKKRKTDDPAPLSAEQKITCNFLQIDITGNAAMSKIELYKNGYLLFTDYLFLYEINEGCRIVSKIYYRHN